MYIVIGLILLCILAFIYSACVVSGRCSREEEKNDDKQY